MPGAGIAGFHRKAAEMALAGIYDLRIHRDEVVIPLVLKLRLFELTGLFPGAEAPRAQLGTFLEDMEGSARRLEEECPRVAGVRAAALTGADARVLGSAARSCPQPAPSG